MVALRGLRVSRDTLVICKWRNATCPIIDRAFLEGRTCLQPGASGARVRYYWSAGAWRALGHGLEHGISPTTRPQDVQSLPQTLWMAKLAYPRLVEESGPSESERVGKRPRT